MQKSQITKSKSQTNYKTKITNSQTPFGDRAVSSGRYDLEERTFEFARKVRVFVKQLPKSICNIEDGRQLVRASGSIGANYIEANEALGKKDFKMRIRITRKEAKESRYWLRLLQCNHDSEAARVALVQESEELTKILSAILQKSQ